MEDAYVVHLSKRKKVTPHNTPQPSPVAASPVVDISTPTTPTPEHTRTRKASHYVHPVVLHITDHDFFLLRRENSGELIHFGKTALPQGTVTDGIILQPEALAEAITLAMHDILKEEHASKAMRGFVCVPKSQTYTKHFTLPKSDDPLTHEMVYEKLAHLLPFSMSSVSVSFSHWTSGTEQYVVAVVVPNTVLTSYASTLELAGITPALIDVEGAALGRALIPTAQNARTLIIDIGARSTALNSYIGHELIASVFAPIGSDKLINVLHKTHTAHDEEVQSTFEDIASTLTQAVTLTIQDLEKLHKTKSIETIYLVGHTVILPILAEHLEKEVGVTTEIGNPLQHLTSYPRALEQDAVLYASAIGLSLRTDTADTTGFNFATSLQPEHQKRELMALLSRSVKKHARELVLLLVVLASFIALFLIL